MRPLPLVACGLLLISTACPGRAENAPALRLDLNDFAGGGWSAFAQRDDVRPRCRVDSGRFRSPPASLAIYGNDNPLEYGGWVRPITGLRAGQYYTLTAYFHAAAINDVRRNVVARLDWQDASGRRAGQPDYAYETAPDGDWTRVTMSVPAPLGATGARLELILGWSPGGTVWWDDITLEEAPAPPGRWVRLGTISLHPRDNPDNLGAYLEQLDRIAADKPDIVCLGEEILNEGNSNTYLGTAEPVPGPSTARLGESARRHGFYIVAGLIERDGKAAYNTSVLIDRQGKLVGKYRKVFLPREEIEGGLTPGDSFPVFDTDFGRIGIMVCWDAEYVEAARSLAEEGAEVILVPAAGGYMTLLKARALENHLFVVSSGNDVESAVIDPTGAVLFETKDSGVAKVVRVDLADRFIDPWLGDMRPRFHKEMRPELLAPPPTAR
jgi:predicted amidohydrolase